MAWENLQRDILEEFAETSRPGNRSEITTERRASLEDRRKESLKKYHWKLSKNPTYRAQRRAFRKRYYRRVKEDQARNRKYLDSVKRASALRRANPETGDSLRAAERDRYARRTKHDSSFRARLREYRRLRWIQLKENPELLEAHRKRQRERVPRRPPRGPVLCRNCNEAFVPRSQKGRPPSYCSRKCRRIAEKARKSTRRDCLQLTLSTV